MSEASAGPAAPLDPRPHGGSPPARTRVWLHAALFGATFLTATMAGAWGWEGTFDLAAPWSELLSPARLAPGLTYAVLLLLILGAHEMGHYLACRYYGVPATLPFFIPGPPMLIGTFGAVIRIRGTIPSRRALFDIAAAGPIAGFVVALPILFVGVARATELSPSAELPGLGLGPPLISTVFERLLHGSADLQVGSLYGAAWVGMLVTSMNLLPVGQLDGGHAVFALSRAAHRPVSWAAIVAMALLVIVQTLAYGTVSAYTVWLLILLFLRDRHPRLAEDTEPLGPGRRIVAAALGLIFVLTFIAAPIVVG